MSTPRTKPKEPRIAFIKRIEHLRQYMEITKSGWVQTEYRFPDWTGISGDFGAWAARVRCDKKHGRLRQKHVDALDQMGFIWDKDDVEKVLSRVRIKPTACNSSLDSSILDTSHSGDVSLERANFILRETKPRPGGYPEMVRDVGSAEDGDLFFGLFYSEAIIRYARADTEVALANQNARPILDKMAGVELGRLAKDDAVAVIWSPPSLFSDVDALFRRWGFSLRHAGYWRKGVLPGHCHTRDHFEYYLVGIRGNPSWDLTPECGRFLQGYIGSHIHYEDRLTRIFHKACNGPALELFGPAARPGWTVLQEPELGERRVNTLLRRAVELSPALQQATALF
jgi:N6-adenosine-specific RNA methylase IME4